MRNDQLLYAQLDAIFNAHLQAELGSLWVIGV